MIHGVKPIFWENCSWKYWSLIEDEEVISLLHSDSALCLGKMNENPQSNVAWEDRLAWIKSSLEYRALDTIDGEPMEFGWNIFPDSPHCSCNRDMFWMDNLHPMGIQGRERMRFKCSTRFSPCIGARQWSFFGPGSEKKWCFLNEWDRHPVFRAASPLSRGTLESKGLGRCRYTIAPTLERLKMFFRTIVSVNQLSIFGAVSNLYEECKTCHVRTRRSFWLDNLTHCLCQV